MIIRPVILAGGSGTRLWPASRQSYPKQLIALTGSRSLLQDTVMRLRSFSAGTVTAPVIVTNQEYRFIVLDQLREVGIPACTIILEPVSRNTAPALTLAALLSPGADADPGADPAADPDADPILFVMPSDHLIANVPAFLAAVSEGAAQAQAGKIVTFGVVPDRPETGYGYIRTGEPIPGAETVRALSAFVEKPDAKTAEGYVAGGAHLWNSGIFMVRRSAWLAALDHYRPAIVETLCATAEKARTDGPFVHLSRAAFSECPSESIDCAVMEQLGSSSEIQAVVLPLDAGWSDVGSWQALWSASTHDECGNATSGEVVLEDTRGTLVHAGQRLVAVLGGRDLVVVDTADAVLVADKSKTADLKTLVAEIQSQNPGVTLAHREAHRPWGRFEPIYGGERFQVKHIVVNPGASLSLQYHHQRAEHWVVVRGTAEVTCGSRVLRLTAGESTYVPVGTPHRLANPGAEPLEIIEVQSGEYLGEDDIVRLEDNYGRLDPGA